MNAVIYEGVTLLVGYRAVLDIGVVQRTVDGYERIASETEVVLDAGGYRDRDGGVSAGRNSSSGRFVGRFVSSGRAL